MVKVLSFNDGIESILDLALSKGKFPVLGVVYGNPVSGAANLISETQRVGNGRNKNKRNKNKRNKSGPYVFNISQKCQYRIIQTFTYSMKLHDNILYLFHCPWERGDPKYFLEDPHNMFKNIRSEKGLKIEIDFNVGIYNKNLFSGINGEYDLLISSEL